MRRAMAACAILGGLCVWTAGPAHAQVFFEEEAESGEFGIYPSLILFRGCGKIVATTLHLPVVRGGGHELVALEQETREPEASSSPERTAIDLARGLLADRIGLDETPGSTGPGTRAERVEAAAALYKRHIAANPEDLVARRELALALVEMRRIDEGAALMHEAYLENPELGIIPMNSLVLGEGKRRLREALLRAVAHAQRDESARAWLLVVVLMQAEERFEVAARMLGRSEGLGLDRAIVEGLGRGL